MSLTKTTRKFLPYGRQHIDESDIEAVVEALKSDFLTTGPTVDAFERTITDYVGEQHAVCVNSGTAALHLAMTSLGLSSGDHVIVPSITFLATANAARWCGAEVLFADVDPENGLMTPQNVQRVFDAHRDKRIKAVVPVHLTGQTENLAEINGIAKSHNCFVIEDACHAIGTEYIDGEKFYIGNCRYSDAVAFSFHPVKLIAMGEGGAITMPHHKLYERARILRNHGMTREMETFLYPSMALGENGLSNIWYYEMGQIGLNYRASDINCALAISQFKKLPEFLEKRRSLVALYDKLLAPLHPIIRPIKKTKYANPAWHIYSVLVDFNRLPFDRAFLMHQLRDNQIGTQVHYIPVHQQPYYQNRYGMQNLPGASAYYERTLTLPLFPAMKEDDVSYVVDRLKKIVGA